MSYLPKERFVQISVTSHNLGDLIVALDESGQAWEYQRDHSVWIPLSRDRAVMEKVESKP